MGYVIDATEFPDSRGGGDIGRGFGVLDENFRHDVADPHFDQRIGVGAGIGE